MRNFRKAKISCKVIAGATISAILLSALTTHLFSCRSVSYADVCALPLSKALPRMQPPRMMHQYNSPVLKGIGFYRESPAEVDFYFDRMDKGALTVQDIEQAGKYFLGFLTINEKDVWVNLSPFEKERIMPQSLAKTDIGKGLLIADYLLKRTTASLLNPNSAYGKKFWQTVYALGGDYSHGEEVLRRTYQRIWIVPGETEIVEYVGHEGKEKGQIKAFIKKAKLNVMVEQDYKAVGSEQVPMSQNKTYLATDHGKLITEIFRCQILPVIERHVNESEAFASLRQLYHVFTLAQYSKGYFGENNAYDRYIDANKIRRLAHKEKGDIRARVYQEYLNRFKAGENKVLVQSRRKGKIIVRRYYSGGIEMAGRGNSQIMTAGKDVGFLTGIFNRTVDIVRFKFSKTQEMKKETHGDTFSLAGIPEHIGKQIKETPRPFLFFFGYHHAAFLLESLVVGLLSLVFGGCQEQAIFHESATLTHVVVPEVSQIPPDVKRQLDELLAEKQGIYASGIKDQDKATTQIRSLIQTNPNNPSLASEIMRHFAVGRACGWYSRYLETNIMKYLVEANKDDVNLAQEVFNVITQPGRGINDATTTARYPAVWAMAGICQTKPELSRDGIRRLMRIEEGLQFSDPNLYPLAIRHIGVVMNGVRQNQDFAGEVLRFLVMEMMRGSDQRVCFAAVQSIGNVLKSHPDVIRANPELTTHIVQYITASAQRHSDNEKMRAAVFDVMGSIVKAKPELSADVLYFITRENEGINDSSEEVCETAMSILRDIVDEYPRSAVSASYYTLKRFNLPVTLASIREMLVCHINPLRGQHAARVILDNSKKCIYIAHNEARFSAQKFKRFAKKKINISESNIDDYTGPAHKNAALEAIEKAPEGATIWFEGHGNPEFVSLETSLIAEGAASPGNSFRTICWQEMGERLVKRAGNHNGRLDDLTVVIGACFSGGFAVKLLNYLDEAYKKGVKIDGITMRIKNIPCIVTCTNRHIYGHGELFSRLDDFIKEPQPALRLGVFYDLDEELTGGDDGVIFVSMTGEEFEEFKKNIGAQDIKEGSSLREDIPSADLPGVELSGGKEFVRDLGRQYALRGSQGVDSLRQTYPKLSNYNSRAGWVGVRNRHTAVSDQRRRYRRERHALKDVDISDEGVREQIDTEIKNRWEQQAASVEINDGIRIKGEHIVAKIIPAEMPRRINGYHFWDEQGNLVIIVRNDFKGELWDETIYHEWREADYENQGFGSWESHVLAAADEAYAFGMREYAVELSEYHQQQLENILKNKDTDRLKRLIDEYDRKKRTDHYAVIKKVHGKQRLAFQQKYEAKFYQALRLIQKEIAAAQKEGRTVNDGNVRSVLNKKTRNDFGSKGGVDFSNNAGRHIRPGKGKTIGYEGAGQCRPQERIDSGGDLYFTVVAHQKITPGRLRESILQMTIKNK